VWALIAVGFVGRVVLAFKTYGVAYDIDSLKSVRDALAAHHDHGVGEQLARPGIEEARGSDHDDLAWRRNEFPRFERRRRRSRRRCRGFRLLGSRRHAGRGYCGAKQNDKRVLSSHEPPLIANC